MKKTRMTIMLMATMTMMTLATACSSDDPLSADDYSYTVIDGSGGVSSSSTSSSSSAYAGMNSFTVAIDKTTAEPESTVAAQYPDTSDAPSANTFSKTVNIDMTNPKDPLLTA